MKMMFRTAALAAACLLGTSALWAQAAASGAAPSTKVGVLNVRQAIASTSEGKQASADLQAQFAPRSTELENLNKQINDLRQRLSTAGEKLSPEEQDRLQRQGEALAKQFQRKKEDFDEDANAAQQEVFQRIGRKMMDVLDRHARENGYVAIFDTSAQASPIIYASNQVDITAEIVKLYDAAYPAKAGAAPATKPAAGAATKPAATTPAPAPTKPKQ